jgi:hypothetical protein
VELPVSFNPKTAFPLDARSMFGSLTDAQEAAGQARNAGSSESVYYYGQQLTVFENDVAKAYIIQGDNTLKELGDGNLPIIKADQLETSFATKVPEGTVANEITKNMSVAIGQNNKVATTRSLVVGANNVVSYADPDPETGEIEVGGNNNLIVGAGNICVQSTGATFGNGNIVGDKAGTGLTGKQNQVNNSLVNGYWNNVQNVLRGTLVNGESNTVLNTGCSIVSGKLNKVDNFSSVAVFGEKLTATHDYQTVVGHHNDLSDVNSLFVVGGGNADAGKNLLSVSLTNTSVNTTTISLNGATSITEKLSANKGLAVSGGWITLPQGQAIQAYTYYKGGQSVNDALLSSAEIKTLLKEELLKSIEVKEINQKSGGAYVNQVYEEVWDTNGKIKQDFIANRGNYRLQTKAKVDAAIQALENRIDAKIANLAGGELSDRVATNEANILDLQAKPHFTSISFVNGVLSLTTY